VIEVATLTLTTAVLLTQLVGLWMLRRIKTSKNPNSLCRQITEMRSDIELIKSKLTALEEQLGMVVKLCENATKKLC